MSRIWLSAACSCWLVFGCSDDNDQTAPPPPLPSAMGTLAYDWSIQGRQVAADCEAVGAVDFQAIVVDQGYIIEGLRVPCTDFGASLPMYVGAFLSRGSLVESDGFPATGRISEDIFVIEEGKVTTLVMDFPDSATPMDPSVLDAGVPVPDADAGTSDDEGVSLPEPDAGTDAGLP